MQFQFPQFIDFQTKIVGPFTLTQFLYVATGGAMIFILQFVLSTTMLIIAGVIIGIISLSFAFIKIESVSLPDYLLNAIGFVFGKKRFLFDNDEASDSYEQAGIWNPEKIRKSKFEQYVEK